MKWRPRDALALVIVAILGLAAVQGGASEKPASLVIQEQGSFAVGGTVVIAPGTFDPIRHGAFNPADQSVAGQTLHGDHAYVFYQIPANARRLPLVMWHGHGQSAKTWETTPDGREGFQTIFLRQRFAVYLVDQPRRGRGSRSTVPMNLPAAPDEQLWFGIFRLGVWPNLFPGVQFAPQPEALEQFFRATVPNTGPFDAEVNVAAVSALFDKIGPGILVTHSQSGGLGWRTAIRNRNVRAIVSYEPASGFPFAEGEEPASVPYAGGGTARPVSVPLADFMLLTKIPIVMYYGDNIPEKPVVEPGPDQWRAFMGMARLWRDAVNRRGGDVTVVHLPEKGIRGNTHFPMSDLNNAQISGQEPSSSTGPTTTTLRPNCCDSWRLPLTIPESRQTPIVMSACEGGSRAPALRSVRPRFEVPSRTSRRRSRRRCRSRTAIQRLRASCRSCCGGSGINSTSIGCGVKRPAATKAKR